MISEADFIKCVASLRKSKGITQTQMGKSMVITQPSYSRIETGAAQPTLKQFIKMLDDVGMELVIKQSAKFQ